MGPTLTRRRFLGALGTCAAYLALVNTMGCEERPSAAGLGSLRTPKAAPPAHSEGLALTRAFTGARRGPLGIPLAPRPEPGRGRGDHARARHCAGTQLHSLEGGHR